MGHRGCRVLRGGHVRDGARWQRQRQHSARCERQHSARAADPPACTVAPPVPSVEVRLQPQVRPIGPGGNGKRFRHLANGVYGYVVYFKDGYSFDWPKATHWEAAGHYTEKYFIYAGSGDLATRHSYWDTFWKTDRHATDITAKNRRSSRRQPRRSTRTS
jgi:hypothetical protein